MEELAKKITYCPDEETFVWTKNGKKAGGIDKSMGYYQIVRPSHKIYGHRLAFACMGEDIPECVDHIDQNRGNNKWNNLRAVEHKGNCLNKSLNSNNSSGYIGVSFDKKRNKWASYIMVDYKKINLGAFFNKSDAIDARSFAEDFYGFHENQW